MSEQGYYRSAVFLYTLGEEAAAEVLKFLEPREVQKIGAAMAAIKAVPREKAYDAVKLFKQVAEKNGSIGVGSDNFLRTVLTKALGQDNNPQVIDQIINNIIRGQDTAGIDGLKWMDAVSISELIINEHPQIIAAILAHMDRDQAGEVLGCFTERLRNDVVLRLATLDGVQPMALKDLNESLAKILSGPDNIKKTQVGGVKVVAEILNNMAGTLEQSVIENVKNFNGDLAQEIIDEMFVFDDLIELDDKSIQIMIKEVEQEMLIVALKAAKAEFKDRVFKNMSTRQAEAAKEDLEARGPMRVSDVEAAQKEILKKVRALVDSGDILMARGQDDAFV